MKLPKRLRIDFRSLKPTYEVRQKRGANERDLVSAGFTECEAARALWNEYGKYKMRYTLVPPEEWFWVDRGWWKQKSGESWLEKQYSISGGAFSDMAVAEQASLFGVELVEMSGDKSRGNLWKSKSGKDIDLIRCVRERLMDESYRMAPAYPYSLQHVVSAYASDEMRVHLNFVDDLDARSKHVANAFDEVFPEPLLYWQKRSEYFEFIANGFRKIKDVNLDHMKEVVAVGGIDFHESMLRRYYENYFETITPPGLPPLFGSKNGKVIFFWAVYKSNLGSDFSGFMRDYAIPMRLNVSIIRMNRAGH